MIPREIFTSFAEFQGIVSVNDFRIPIGFQELLKLLWVSCEVLFLHGYDWIDWVAKSCTTTAYWWLFRDSQLSLRTLWSAVIKSPNFSARGTASPLRLLHGALVILVRLQISQFRSLGKWEETLCLPKSSRLLNVRSKDTSWEELACESLRSRTSSSTKFSLNSCSHSGISGSNGLLRSVVVSSGCRSRQTASFPVLSWSLFFGFWIFGWLGSATRIGSKQRVFPFYHLFNMLAWHGHWRGIYPTQILPFSSLTVAWYCCSWWRRRAWGRCRMITLLSSINDAKWTAGCPDRSSAELDTCTGEMLLLFPSSRSRIWISLTVGEEDAEEWLSCLEGVFEVDEDSEDELDKPGTTIGTKFSVLQGIRIPFFNEMWFLTSDPFIGISVFIAKLSKRQYCWRVIEDFNSQEYIQFFDIHRCFFMRLHFSIGG